MFSQAVMGDKAWKEKSPGGVASGGRLSGMTRWSWDSGERLKAMKAVAGACRFGNEP